MFDYLLILTISYIGIFRLIAKERSKRIQFWVDDDDKVFFNNCVLFSELKRSGRFELQQTETSLTKMMIN